MSKLAQGLFLRFPIDPNDSIQTILRAAIDSGYVGIIYLVPVYSNTNSQRYHMYPGRSRQGHSSYLGISAFLRG